MAQNIGISYGGSLTSQAFNDRFSQLIGGNLVYLGYNITAGTGKALNIIRGTDNISALFINGVSITEDGDLSNVLTIPDNSTGSTRNDVVYATYNHGNNAVCTYGIATNTTTVPNGSCCLIGRISVPNGFTSSSQVTITPESKMYDLAGIKNLLRVGASSPQNPQTNMVWIDTN